ncbi:MAG: hypothetical protein NT074_06260 [Methanomicrobiales archaeon]|nr:hypothetical protein [Methanomicrobiales archaeon]
MHFPLIKPLLIRSALLASFSVVILIVMLTFAGCSGTSGPPPTPTPPNTLQQPTTPLPTTLPLPTTTQPTTSGTPTPVPTLSLGPGPIDPLPDYIEPGIDVKKDRVYSGISVTYGGGLGQGVIREVRVKVTRSDGTIEEKTLPFSNPDLIGLGDSVTLQGTRRPDRVEVTLLAGGKYYRVFNETLAEPGFYE